MQYSNRTGNQPICMPLEVIRTDKAPKPAAFFSQATKCGNILYTAGQGACDPATGSVVGANIEEQTKRTLDNLKAILDAAGYSLTDVLKVNIFLKRISDFQGMNKIYSEYFKQKPPARTTVQSELANPSFLIEIDAVACKG